MFDNTERLKKVRKNRIKIGVGAVWLLLVPWAIVVSLYLYSRALSVPRFNSKAISDLQWVERAVEGYAHRYGEYPPDFTSKDPVQEAMDHMYRIFPLWDEKDFPAYAKSMELGPHNALEFWLRGFHPDPSFPMSGPPEPTEVFQSVPRSLLSTTVQVDMNGQIILAGDSAPLVYFNSENYDRASFESRNSGVAVPYLRSNNKSDPNRWAEPNAFQLISAGADGRFGSGRSMTLNTASRYDEHSDNLVHFRDLPLGHDAIYTQISRARTAFKLSPLVAILCSVIYLVSLQLRHREDGMVLLRKSIQKECAARERSPRWNYALQYQREQYRKRAIDRFKTKD